MEVKARSAKALAPQKKEMDEDPVTKLAAVKFKMYSQVELCILILEQLDLIGDNTNPLEPRTNNTKAICYMWDWIGLDFWVG